ncbi:heavy-metal-associated domain-containing protein [Mycobacterium sp. GA-2829]|uniref:heavy-metal-associated domain-containing protein n=1 Tax=Mycobacterium sp. GA-2829 TaxID=1772283 RepID=UPI0007400B1D|nr:cation transporter [Mycobacterium sp. GA-2829]KUI33253.1 heavy metal transporter [Mycobacterium sp. GA-2829]
MSLKLNVAGMSCAHCVSSITKAVEPLPGVTGVTVDLDAAAVTVSGTPEQGAVVAAIEDCGYDVNSAA